MQTLQTTPLETPKNFPLMALTEAAARRVQELMDQRGRPAAGIRIGVKSKGCNGLAYVLEYVDTPLGQDKVVEDKGVTLFIDPKALMFVIGTEMDFIQETFESGFVFRNPNEKGKCGCGESFHV